MKQKLYAALADRDTPPSVYGDLKHIRRDVAGQRLAGVGVGNPVQP